MTLSSQSLAADLHRPLIIVRGRAQDLPLRLREAGVDVTPASGTVALYRDALQSSTYLAPAALTPGATSYYPLPAVPATEALSANWVATWTWIASTVTYSDRQRVVLVGQELRPRVSVDDLYGPEPDLRHPARIPAGQTTHQPQISSAWDDILSDLTRRGRQPWLAIDAGDLYQLHLLRSLARVCGAIPGAPDSHYQQAASRYRREAEAAFIGLSIEYEAEQGTSRAAGPSVIPLAPAGRQQ